MYLNPCWQSRPPASGACPSSARRQAGRARCRHMFLEAAAATSSAFPLEFESFAPEKCAMEAVGMRSTTSGFACGASGRVAAPRAARVSAPRAVAPIVCGSSTKESLIGKQPVVFPAAVKVMICQKELPVCEHEIAAGGAYCQAVVEAMGTWAQLEELSCGKPARVDQRIGDMLTMLIYRPYSHHLMARACSCKDYVAA